MFDDVVYYGLSVYFGCPQLDQGCRQHFKRGVCLLKIGDLFQLDEIKNRGEPEKLVTPFHHF